MEPVAFPLRRWRVVVRAGALALVAILALASFVGGTGIVALLVFLITAPVAAWLARPLLTAGPALTVGPETLAAPYAGVELPLAAITSARLESRGDLRTSGAMVLVLGRTEGGDVRVATGVVLAEPERILAAVRARI